MMKKHHTLPCIKPVVFIFKTFGATVRMYDNFKNEYAKPSGPHLILD
jgi:hypothetical protein